MWTPVNQNMATDMDRPAGLVTLKTVLEASTSEHPIEARLFETYVYAHGNEA